MEVDNFSLSKILNLLIRKFLTEIENFLESINVDKNKVFQEVLKRSLNVSQGIRQVALRVLANMVAGEQSLNEILDNKVKTLMESVLEQDLIECALSSTSSSSKIITNDNLFDSLFFCSLNDMNSMTSSFDDLYSKMSAEDFKLCLTTNEVKNVFQISENSDWTSLSSQFTKSKIQFEEELWQLQSSLDVVSPSADLKSSEVYSKLSHEVNTYLRNTMSSGFNESDSVIHNIELEDWLSSSDMTCSSNNLLNFKMPFGYTWEGRMKQFVPCHLYSSELTEKEALFNVTDDDPQVFQSLYNVPSAISEEDIKHDILDLLVGIPSNTFIFGNNGMTLEFRPHVHLAKLTHESTLKFVEKFVMCGNTFIKLKMFSSELFPNQEGFVLSGFKNGIQQILSLYAEYIMSVKMQKPTLQFLKTDVLEAAQLLNILELISRLNEESIFPQLAKGLRLISYLNENLWSQRRKENAIMIGVIFKHVYAPYFNFLNKWIDEGICYDPYDEFQILEDFEYLDRKDELYWKYAHTEIVSDETRIIPSELENYSADIMQCGKNMRLLKICCPQLFSLEFMLHNTPPSLSMIFSYNAASVKAENCISYIQNMEKAELNHSNIQSEKTQQTDCLTNFVKLNHSGKNVYSLRKYNSIENVASKFICKNDIVLRNIGILFSSCDYSGCSDLTFLNFAEQLNNTSMSNEEFSNLKQNKKNVSSNLDEKYSLNSNKNYSNLHEASTNKIYSKKLSATQLFNEVHSEINCKTETVTHFSEKCEVFKYSEDLLPGTFTNSLASLLLSNYGDTIYDVNSCLQLISLQNLMSYNLKAVLDTRLHIVKKLITDYFMNQLKLQDLLICLKNTYLLLDETFSQTLCEKLFPWALNSQTVYQFANWTMLNEMFCNSFTEVSTTDFPILATGSVNVIDLPEKDILERYEYFRFFQFEFQVKWPLNIIIHKGCIAQYMQAFSFLLELEFLCWLLGRTWWSLHIESAAAVQNSSQFKEIMLIRFDMHQFICVLRNCIRHDLQGPVWDFLSKSLSTEKLSIDSLECIHIQYLEQILTRCFLTQETKSLHTLVEVICRQIYKFCIWILESIWEFNEVTNQYEASTFNDLCTVFDVYRNYHKTFYNLVMKLTVTRKHEAYMGDGFKQYLETILGSKRMYL